MPCPPKNITSPNWSTIIFFVTVSVSVFVSDSISGFLPSPSPSLFTHSFLPHTISTMLNKLFPKRNYFASWPEGTLSQHKTPDFRMCLSVWKIFAYYKTFVRTFDDSRFWMAYTTFKRYFRHLFDWCVCKCMCNSMYLS